MNEQDQMIHTELLVVRCQQGDREAFELIVELWQRPMLMFALRYLDQEIDTWDAVQETWISAIKGLDRLQNPSLFVSWLFRILTNKCIDHVRKEHSEASKLKRANISLESSDISSESDSLAQAIHRLSDEHKILVLLRFAQGLQIGHIASMLNLPEGTVKSRLHRALARLRQVLGDKHD